jgi:hypothetical protein
MTQKHLVAFIPIIHQNKHILQLTHLLKNNKKNRKFWFKTKVPTLGG